MATTQPGPPGDLLHRRRHPPARVRDVCQQCLGGGYHRPRQGKTLIARWNGTAWK